LKPFEALENRLGKEALVENNNGSPSKEIIYSIRKLLQARAIYAKKIE
jgi:hypothetical protein